MTDSDTPKAELILYQTEDGRTRIERRFEGGLSVAHVTRTASEVA